MPFQKKLNIVLVLLTAAGLAGVIAFLPNPGRPAVGVLVVGCLSWFVTSRIAHSRYLAVMKTAGAALGLDCIASPAEESRSEFLTRMRQTRERDVFRWKVDGLYPVLVGSFGGFPVTVRIPVGMDFDAGAPDSTRLAVHHDSKLTGFAIYDRSRLRKTPKGRQVTLDDAAFDSRYLVLAHRAEEAKSVLGPRIRAALLEAGSIGFRGIVVNRYGVFLHEEGKVSNADVVRRRLELLAAVAGAVRGLAPGAR